MNSHPIIIRICILALPLFLFGSSIYGQKGFRTKLGEDFPNFEMTDLQGETFTIKDLSDKPTLIVFFGIYCGPCQFELNEIHKFDPEWHENLHIVVVGWKSNADQLSAYKAKKKYNLFRYVPDASRDLFAHVADSSLPRTFIVDTSGKIIYQNKGYNKYIHHMMTEKIKQVIVDEPTTSR